MTDFGREGGGGGGGSAGVTRPRSAPHLSAGAGAGAARRHISTAPAAALRSWSAQRCSNPALTLSVQWQRTAPQRRDVSQQRRHAAAGSGGANPNGSRTDQGGSKRTRVAPNGHGYFQTDLAVPN